MPTNYTPNYQLNQWERSDAVLMDDFNADNAKIDAAIAAVAGSKASASELNSLRSTVNSLSSTVSGQGYSLGRKGNCQIVVTSYTGNGQTPFTLTFPRKPVMFFITGNSFMAVGYGATSATHHENSNYGVTVAWSGNSVTLSYNGASGSEVRAVANVPGQVYQMITLYDQSA